MEPFSRTSTTPMEDRTLMESRTHKKSPRPAKHITRACAGCRQRKTKCDGGKPRCANCRLHNQECIMPLGVDKRTLPSKERYTRLEQYAQSLESVIIRNGIAIPEVLDGYPTPGSMLVWNPAQAERTQGQLHEIPGAEERRDDITPRDGTSDPVRSPTVRREERHETETESNAVDLLSERFGSLQVAEDGQLRFFGATSNLHISHVGPFPLTESNIRSIHGKEQDILYKAGVDYHVPNDLEEHLLRLYFCWENPNIPVVEEETYYEERRRYRRTGRASHRYSEVLTNAMCAVGAALTRRQPLGLPESLTEFFSSRAKALLDVEMDCPTLCTVQALVILSGVEALLTRDARGWLYSGMAMRLATDLGLHLRPGSSRRRDLLDPEEIKLRKIVFWGAYIHDRLWSFYVGRPESLDEKHIAVDLLQADEDESPWILYRDDGRRESVVTMPSLLSEVAHYSITLCQKMSDIRRVLYSSASPNGHEIRQLHDSACRFRSELRSWAADLPPSLSLDNDSHEQRPPHVLQLHMQYYAILVIIDRPFTHGPSPSTLPGLTPASISESHIACTTAASAIVKLLQTFRQHYGLSNMNIHTVHLIFTAALVHIHNVYFAPSEEMRTAARRSLQVCCQGLAEIGNAYKNALRALEIITCIKADLSRGQELEDRKRVSADVGGYAGDLEGMGKRARVGRGMSDSLSGTLGMSGVYDARDEPGRNEGLLSDADTLGGSLDLAPDLGLFADDRLFMEPWTWTLEGNRVEV